MKKNLRTLLTIVFIVSALTAVGCWFSNSSYTFSQYSRICSNTHQDAPGFKICMQPYWNTYYYYQFGLYFMAAVGAGAFLLILYNEVRKKKVCLTGDLGKL